MWRVLSWIMKVVGWSRWRGGVNLDPEEMREAREAPPAGAGKSSGREESTPSVGGFLESLAHGAGKVTAWLRPGAPIKRPQVSDAELWHSYRKQVEEAQDHPATTALDRYFLAPERLSKDQREHLGAHIRGCLRCQDIESYYRSYGDHLRLRKDCD